jgi:hypothetical protein
MTKQKQDNKTFSVTLYGFKTREAALRFVNWYEKQGEQWYYDHLEILDNDNLYKEGCNIDVTRTGNNGSYYDVTPSGVEAWVVIDEASINECDGR